MKLLQQNTDHLQEEHPPNNKKFSTRLELKAKPKNQNYFITRHEMFIQQMIMSLNKALYETKLMKPLQTYIIYIYIYTRS